MKSSFVSYPSQIPLDSVSRIGLYCIGQPIVGDDERGDMDIEADTCAAKFTEETLLPRRYLF